MTAKLQTVHFFSQDVVYCDYTTSTTALLYNHFVPDALYLSTDSWRIYSGKLIQYTGPGQVDREVQSTAIIVDDEVIFGAYYHLVQGLNGQYTICENQHHGLQ